MHNENNKQTKILLTGASGFLGQYMSQIFGDCDIKTLQRSVNADISCDLTHDVPKIRESFDIVIHCAGTINQTDAMSINYEGTRRLLDGLEQNPPHTLILISTTEVYGKQDGENIDEETPLRPTTKFAHSKVLAERAVTEWCATHTTEPIILRIATPFGNGIHGPIEQTYNKILCGTYLHVRGNESRRSVVCAYDVALVARKLVGHQGIFNIADGCNRHLHELTDAMAANGGDSKRVLVIPDKWAKKIASLGSIMPFLHLPFNKKSLARELSGPTYSIARLKATIEHDFFDTVEVIARRERNYPYSVKY